MRRGRCCRLYRQSVCTSFPKTAMVANVGGQTWGSELCTQLC